MGVRTEHCVVIEDSHCGVLAARQANMTCFAYVLYTDSGELLAQEGSILFSSMAKLAGLLELVVS